RVGGYWMAKGYARVGVDPYSIWKAAKFAMDRSEFMRHRMQSHSPEVAALRKSLKAGLIPLPVAIPGLRMTKRALDKFNEAAFTLMSTVQFVSVDLQTWYAMWYKAKAAGLDEAEAIAQADQAVVDAQGGGELHQTAAIQTG